MSREIHWCEVCGTSYNVERHHIMFRSEVKALENCKLNYSYLCPEHLTKEEVQEVLKIADKPLNRLLKPLRVHKGKYIKEEVIRACMGGKLIIEGDNIENQKRISKKEGQKSNESSKMEEKKLLSRVWKSI